MIRASINIAEIADDHFAFSTDKTMSVSHSSTEKSESAFQITLHVTTPCPNMTKIPRQYVDFGDDISFLLGQNFRSQLHDCQYQNVYVLSFDL